MCLNEAFARLYLFVGAACRVRNYTSFRASVSLSKGANISDKYSPFLLVSTVFSEVWNRVCQLSG